MNNEKMVDDLRAALLKTQALALCLESRLTKAEEEIESIKRENHVEKYASSF